jgi:hypothetical protein
MKKPIYYSEILKEAWLKYMHNQDVNSILALTLLPEYAIML